MLQVATANTLQARALMVDSRFVERITNFHENLQSQFALLGATEGFPLLSCRQQKIIKVSLYLQSRALRNTDEASAKAIIWPEGDISDGPRILPMNIFSSESSIPRPSKRKYWFSQNHIYRWYCHAAIACLEGTIPLAEMPDEFDNGFFNAKYRLILSLDDAKKIIERFRFPCVVHISCEEDNKSSQAGMEHSFLALGHDKNNSIVVYDKEGYEYPYRVTDLSTIYESYGPSYWGVRKLKIR